jgi:hypothetical protein
VSSLQGFTKTQPRESSPSEPEIEKPSFVISALADQLLEFSAEVMQRSNVLFLDLGGRLTDVFTSIH